MVGHDDFLWQLDIRRSNALGLHAGRSKYVSSSEFCCARDRESTALDLERIAAPRVAGCEGAQCSKRLIRLEVTEVICAPNRAPVRDAGDAEALGSGTLTPHIYVTEAPGGVVSGRSARRLAATAMAPGPTITCQVRSATRCAAGSRWP